MRLPAFLGIALLGTLSLGACSALITGGAAEASKVGFDPSRKAVPDLDAEDYGLDGTLSQADVLAMTYLEWPQSYDAVSGRFGFPAKRNESTDYYQTPGGQWVAVFYDGAVATGYSISDSQ
ncbi:MAG: hypothetical protein F6J97_24285 [Leptolyngbya sp. SIO4C1]|nr:hypothetical protein [Leptolyngbya sp. SIO4C1]